jgi:hypothetical protein
VVTVIALLRTALLIHALDARGAIGAGCDSRSILGLGLSPAAGLCGFHPVLIRLRDSSIARMWVVGGLVAIAALRGRYAAWRFLRRRHRAFIRIDGNSALTVAADGFTEPVGDAIRCGYTGSEKYRGHGQ